jgi:hypothetical protein
MEEICLQIEIDFPLLSNESYHNFSSLFTYRTNPKGVPVLLLLFNKFTSVITLSFSQDYYSNYCP